MKNADISARRDASISQGVGVMTQIYVDRADNSEVWDVEGNRYIDFAAGIGAHTCYALHWKLNFWRRGFHSNPILRSIPCLA
jgi:4-aminobutyrate aminotransferase-like enzyme